jgi:repressor LexA
MVGRNMLLIPPIPSCSSASTKIFPKDPVMNLTPRQLDVLVAIRNYRHLHGYSPTMQELADQLGTSKVTIFEHVGALEKKRVLRRDKHKARSLEITADERLPDEDRATKLPLLGNIAAGSPIEAVENREELDLEQLFHSRNGVYVLRVRGESMIDDHLCDGDYVVIERRENARNGEQVVALLDSGEATLKRYYKEGGKIRLQPANKSMEPRIVDPDRLKIQGVVIGVLRSYA